MTDTSTEAVETARYNLAVYGPHGYRDLITALAAERDALRQQLSEARNSALDEAAALFIEEAEHDEGGIQYSADVGIPISNAADLSKSADRARRNAAAITALKTGD